MAAVELKSSDLDALAKMADYEKTMPENKKELGWSWQEVAVYPATIQKLMLAGLVELRYSSNRYKNYMLTEKAALVLTDASEPHSKPTLPAVDVSGLFSEIVGYDDLKELLREVLLAEDAIHVLVHGPPSLCKSLFLSDIERAVGSHALMLLGSSTSHSGMWDILVERKPRYLLLDELEKMGLSDMAALLSLMESKRIVRAKVGRMLEETIDVRVIAAANVIRKLPPELVSRFWCYNLSEYKPEEYIRVVQSVLQGREGISTEDSKAIALCLVGKSHDVRDAIRIARLSKRIGVGRSIALWVGGK